MKSKIRNWRFGKSLGLVLALYAVIMSIAGVYAYAGGGTTTVTGQVTVTTTCAFTENVATVQFGGAAGLAAGSHTTGTSANSVLVTNAGDATSNILIYGASWSWATPSGASYSNTIYSTLSNSLWNPESSTALQQLGVEVQLAGSQVDTGIPVNTLAGNTIWLGLNTMPTTPSGSYTQTIDFVSSC